MVMERTRRRDLVIIRPPLPWTVKLMLSLLSFAVNISRRSNVTVNRRLFSLFDLKASPSPKKPRGGVTSSDFTVDPIRRLWFRLYAPSSSAITNLPVIVFFHGGGFAFMSASSKPFDDMCRRWARLLPAVIVSVDYRLSPKYKYPSQYHDGFDTLTFLDGHAFDLDLDLSRCFLAGDSAGGNIAHHVALRAHSHTFQNLKIRGVLSLQPFFGGEERTESEIRLDKAPFLSMNLTDWMWRAFLPEGSDRDHPAANIFCSASPDLSSVDFPATLIVIGGYDLLQDRQRMYFETLKGCGVHASLVEYPNAIHGFYLFPELSDSSLLIDQLRSFITKQSAT